MNRTLHLAAPAPQPQPAALPPRTGLRGPVLGGAVAAAVLVLGLFGSAALVDIAGAVVANGTLAVQGRPKAVQHLDGGIVREIHVRNGSEVKQGDLLVRLDETTLRANAEIQLNRLREGLARRTRLEAERDGKPAIDWNAAAVTGLPEAAPAPLQREVQRKLFAVRRDAQKGQGSQRNEKVKQIQNQIVGTRGQIAAKTEQMQSIEGELTGLRDLQKGGYVPATRILSLEREMAALAGQVAEHRAELGRLANSVDETRIGVLQGEREFQENVLSELRQVSAETSDVAQQYRATMEQLRRVEIRAPESGVVHELNVVTVGGVIAPGAVLMQIVSADSGQVVDAGVEPHFIDQLSRDQPATVRFPAFSRDETPELPARVHTISPTSVVDERTGATFYRVELRLAPDDLARLKSRHAVVPGMPVEVYLRTGDRSVLSFLFKPLRDQLQRAMRER